MLVWSRALGLLTPLSSKLGPMLYILRRGAEEAGVLVPVVLVLMLVRMLGNVTQCICYFGTYCITGTVLLIRADTPHKMMAWEPQ